MKLSEWDVVAHHEGKEQKEITSDSVCFMEGDTRIEISFDKESGGIKIQKVSRSSYDSISIHPKFTNCIIIK